MVEIHQFAPNVKPVLERMWAVRDRSDLKSVDKLLLIALLMRDGQGGCFPSIQTIADDTGLHPATVKRHLSSLEQRSLIIRTRRKDSDGEDLSTLYQVREGAHREPPPGADCATPRRTVRHEDNLEDNLEEKRESAMKDSNGANGFQEEVVTLEPLAIHGRLRAFWLQQFGSEADLDLALMQIEPYLQTKSFNYSAEKMVSSQLARIARERNERQRRYEAARDKGRTDDSKVIDWDKFFADREARKAREATP